jgi:hypothetical protein
LRQNVALDRVRRFVLLSDFAASKDRLAGGEIILRRQDLSANAAGFGSAMGLEIVYKTPPSRGLGFDTII